MATTTFEDGAVTTGELDNLTMAAVFLARLEKDLIPPALIKMAADLIPHATYVRVSHAVHSIDWELPDEFNRVLEELLANALVSIRRVSELQREDQLKGSCF